MGGDINKLFEDCKDIVVKSILSMGDTFYKKIKEDGYYNNNFFEMFAYDFLVDKNFKTYLLEINRYVGYNEFDLTNKLLYERIWNDALNLIGFVPFDHETGETFNKKGNGPETIEDSVDRAICEIGRPRGEMELAFPNKKKLKKIYKIF